MKIDLIERDECDYCSSDSRSCSECGGRGYRSLPWAGAAKSAANQTRAYWLAWYSRQRRGGRYIDREFDYEPLLPRWAAKRLADHGWLRQCREEGFTGTIDEAAKMSFTERLTIIYSTRRLNTIWNAERPFLALIPKAS